MLTRFPYIKRMRAHIMAFIWKNASDASACVSGDCGCAAWAAPSIVVSWQFEPQPAPDPGPGRAGSVVVEPASLKQFGVTPIDCNQLQNGRTFAARSLSRGNKTSDTTHPRGFPWPSVPAPSLASA